MLRRRNLLLLENGGILPKEYKQVEYIGNSGNAYINMGINPNNAIGVEIKYSKASGSYGSPYGCWLYSGGTSTGHVFKDDVNKLTTILFGNSSGPSITKDTINTIINNQEGFFFNGSRIEDHTGRTFSSIGINMHLFGNSRKDGSGSEYHENFKGNIYYCIVTKNGVKIRDYIPCYRISDGANGMFDIVNKVFYSGNFTRGPEV